MKFKIYFLLILMLSSTACSFKGNLQGLYSFHDKTKSKAPELLVEPTPGSFVCDAKKTDTPKVYIANGFDIKKCIATSDAVVYIWSPKCKSKFCYTPELLQQSCDFKSIELLIVAEYYNAELMQINYNIKRPIYGIDTNYYNSNLTSQYLSGFLYDLTAKKDVEKRVLYFNDGKFINSYDSVWDISSR